MRPVIAGRRSRVRDGRLRGGGLGSPGMHASSPDELLSAAGCLPLGPCPSCARDVVGYASPEDETRHLCVHCDSPLPAVNWGEEGDLAQFGYDLTDPAAGGCATGCAAGGCGTLALSDLRAQAVKRQATPS